MGVITLTLVTAGSLPAGCRPARVGDRQRRVRRWPPAPTSAAGDHPHPRQGPHRHRRPAGPPRTSSALVILVSSRLGFPLSTTHVLRRDHRLRRRTAGRAGPLADGGPDGRRVAVHAARGRDRRRGLRQDRLARYRGQPSRRRRRASASVVGIYLLSRRHPVTAHSFQVPEPTPAEIEPGRLPPEQAPPGYGGPVMADRARTTASAARYGPPTPVPRGSCARPAGGTTPARSRRPPTCSGAVPHRRPGPRARDRPDPRGRRSRVDPARGAACATRTFAAASSACWGRRARSPTSSPRTPPSGARSRRQVHRFRLLPGEPAYGSRAGRRFGAHRPEAERALASPTAPSCSASPPRTWGTSSRLGPSTRTTPRSRRS